MTAVATPAVHCKWLQWRHRQYIASDCSGDTNIHVTACLGLKNCQALCLLPGQHYSNRCYLAGCICVVRRVKKLAVAHIFHTIFSSYCKPKMSFCVDNSPCWTSCAMIIKHTAVSCSLQFALETLQPASDVHSCHCTVPVNFAGKLQYFK